jgi:hypothetical protein
MRRHILCLALLLPAGCAQLLGYSEPSEGTMAGGGDSGIPMNGADGGFDTRDSGLPGSKDGAVGPPGQCADLPSFEAAVHYGGVMPMAEDLAVGDLNRDGHRDVVIVGSMTSQLEIHLGATNGALTGQMSLPFTPVQPCSGGSNAVAIGDFDGDTFADLAYTAGVACGRVVVRRQNPSMPGVFLAEQQVVGAQGGASTAGITVADVNGDGRSDLVYLSDSSVQLYLARTDVAGGFTNGFTDPISGFHGGKGPGARIVDLNGDGRVDIAWLSSSGVQYKLQSATTAGSFGNTLGLGDSSLIGFATGDLDGDGLTDVLVSSGSTAEKFLQNPTSHLFTGSGTFQLAFPPEDMDLVDVNSDGRLDIVARGEAVLQCEPGPPGTFGSQPLPINILSTPNAFFFDLTGEGKKDGLGIDTSTNNLIVRLQN